MSIDNYYIQIDSDWVRINGRVVNGESIPNDYISGFATDFWVDICHKGNFLIDERYYFVDLASARDFYWDGWKQRQYLDDNGTGVGLDHKGLYSRGELIDGVTVHGDPPEDDE